MFCFRCGRIIHGPKGCPESNSRKPSHDGGLERWGHWLRADDQSKRLGLAKGQQNNRSPSPEAADNGQAIEPMGRKSDMETQKSAVETEAIPVEYSPAY